MKSLDDSISEKLGLQNDDGPLLQSVSYLAIGGLLVVAGANVLKHGGSDPTRTVLLLGMAIAGFVLLSIFRRALAKTANAVESENVKAQLRRLSSLAVRITGLLMLACFLAAGRS